MNGTTNFASIDEVGLVLTSLVDINPGFQALEAGTKQGTFGSNNIKFQFIHLKVNFTV